MANFRDHNVSRIYIEGNSQSVLWVAVALPVLVNFERVSTETAGRGRRAGQTIFRAIGLHRVWVQKGHKNWSGDLLIIEQIPFDPGLMCFLSKRITHWCSEAWDWFLIGTWTMCRNRIFWLVNCFFLLLLYGNVELQVEKFGVFDPFLIYLQGDLNSFYADTEMRFVCLIFTRKVQKFLKRFTENIFCYSQLPKKPLSPFLLNKIFFFSINERLIK